MTKYKIFDNIYFASGNKDILGSHNLILIVNSEKYSRGRRGAPAKGVGRVTGARVQIPLSPLLAQQKLTNKKFKKVVDKRRST